MTLIRRLVGFDNQSGNHRHLEGGYWHPRSALFARPIYLDPKTAGGVANIYIRDGITYPPFFVLSLRKWEAA